MIEIREKNGVLLIRVRVQPGASAERVGGEFDGALKLKVRSVPEKGKANRAARELLAAALGVPPSSLALLRGGKSRDKVFSVRGVGMQEARRLLGLQFMEPPVSRHNR